MPVKTNTQGADEGFTLAEVLVALAIVMVVGLAALGGVLGGLSSQRAAEGHDVAVQVAVDRLEEVRQLRWDRIAFDEVTLNMTGETGYDYTTPYYPCGPSAGCSGEPVAYLDGTPPSNPLHATVTMSGYTVHTYITWVLPAGETTYPMNQEGDRYAPKRVRIVVVGTQDGRSVEESIETVIAPPVNQSPPPGVPVTSTATATTASTTTSTCPTAVTVIGTPPILEWTSVADGVVSYRIIVNGSLREMVTHDGRSRYAWTGPLYATETTFEVQGVTSTGDTFPCTPVVWDPAQP